MTVENADVPRRNDPASADNRRELRSLLLRAWDGGVLAPTRWAAQSLGFGARLAARRSAYSKDGETKDPSSRG